jgi:PAS domain S-box-containing protein
MMAYPKTILIVEDEAIIAMNEKLLFEKEGYLVHSVSTGESAVDLVCEKNIQIDLILMDINLGKGIDGITAAQQISQSRDIPIIFHSAYIDKQTLAKARSITSYGMISKNTPFAALLASVETAVQLHQAHLKLQESEARFRQLVEGSPDIVYTYSRKHGGIYYSPRVEQVFGYPVEYLYDHPFLWDQSIHPDDLPSVEKAVQEFDHGVAFDLEYRVQDARGNWRWLHDRSIGRVVRDGEFFIEGLASDITDQKRTEFALRESEEKYRSLFENEIFAIKIFDQKTLRILDVNEAFVRSYGYSREEIMGGMSNPDFSAEVEATSSAVVNAIQNGIKFIPLRYHRKKDGAIFPIEIAVSPYTWRGQAVMFSIERDISAQLEAQRMQKASESRLSLAMDIANLASWEYDPERDALILNDRFYALLGTTAEREGGYQLTPNEYILRFVYGKNRRRIIDTFKASTQAQPSALLYQEHCIIRSDGEVRWVALRPNMNTDPSQKTVLGTIQDITERYQAEEALRASEERYRLLFQNMQEGFGLYDVIVDDQNRPTDFTFLEVNKTYEMVSGRKQADVIGRRASEMFPPVDPELIRIFGNVALTGQAVTFDYHLKPNDRYLRIHVFSPMPGRFATIFDDITQSRAAELALRESERVRMEANERFRSLFEQTHDAVFILDLAGKHITANARAAEMLGYSMEELLKLSLDDTSAAIEEDHSIINLMLAGEHIPLYERNFRKKDGLLLPAEINVELVRDINGVPLYIQSVVRDISQRKAAEAAIQKLLSEKELLMREVHHRIKNNMNTISGLLALHAQTLEEPKAVLALQDADSRVRSMMTLYDRLYRSGNYLQLDAPAYLGALLNDIAQTWEAPNRQIKIVQEIENIPLPIERSIPLGIFINECITNAYKYAFPLEQIGTILVSLKSTGDTLEVIVANDGDSMPTEIDLETSTSFGLSLIKMMARQLDANLQIIRESGTHIKMIIPLAAP